MRRMLSFAILLFFVSCSRDPMPPPLTPDVGPDAGDYADEVDASAGPTCSSAGSRIKRLGCKGASGKPLWVSSLGTPWATVCRDAQKSGRTIRVDCISSMKSCGELERLINLGAGESCQ